MSKDWKNEDEIKAELRVLTDELRTLRHELRNMVTPQKPQNPSRLHRQAWPSRPPAAKAAEEKRDSRAKKKR